MQQTQTQVFTASWNILSLVDWAEELTSRLIFRQDMFMWELS